MHPNVSVLGDLIKKHREKLGYSQKRVSSSTSISSTNLSYIENGQRDVFNITELIKLITLLEIAPSKLINLILSSNSIENLNCPHKREFSSLNYEIVSILSNPQINDSQKEHFLNKLKTEIEYFKSFKDGV